MNDNCIIWDKAVNHSGYPIATYGSRTDGSRKTKAVYREIYKDAYGEIPEGYQIDHLCRNRRCINPLHLEAVTPQENVRRSLPFRNPLKYGAHNRSRTHCKNGHAFDYVHPKSGKRGCRTCRNATAINWQLANGRA